MSNPVSDAYKAFADRFNGQVTGTVTIFLILWNWKALVLLIYENGTAADRITSIQNLYTSHYSIFEQLIPIGFAAIYLWGVPKIRALHFRYIQSFKVRERLQEQEDERLIAEIAQHGTTLGAILGQTRRHIDALKMPISQCDVVVRDTTAQISNNPNSQAALNLRDVSDRLSSALSQIKDLQDNLESFKEAPSEFFFLRTIWRRALNARAKLLRLKPTS